MNAETLEKQFKSSVCSDIELVKEGIDRYQIFTPFRFDDGDHYVTVLKKRGDRWIISERLSNIRWLCSHGENTRCPARPCAPRRHTV